MTKLPGLSSDEVLQALRKVGFVYAPKRGKGSHTAWLVIVPKRRDLPQGALRAIIEQAGLTRAEFLKLL
jgi:predicted RNA binding protein YcfA (HicA-like mRNA interferase family)